MLDLGFVNKGHAGAEQGVGLHLVNDTQGVAGRYGILIGNAVVELPGDDAGGGIIDGCKIRQYRSGQQFHTDRGDGGRAVAHPYWNDIPKLWIIGRRSAAIDDIDSVGNDFIGGQHRIPAIGYGRFGHRQNWLNNSDGCTVGLGHGRTGSRFIVHIDRIGEQCGGSLNDAGIRQNACAIDDFNGIRCQIAKGIVHDVTDGPCEGTGLTCSRHVGGSDGRIGEIRACTAAGRGVGRSGIAIDTNGFHKDHAAGQGILGHQILC